LERKTKIIIKALLAMFSALALWEVILENTIAKSPGFLSHPVLGRINKSGIVVQGEEGFSRTKVNNLGMRGEDISPKAKNEYRILFLGDSYTKALQVSDEETYVNLLEKNLKHYSNSQIKTINFGRDGSSPAQYIHVANFYNSYVQPDTVIIQVNDLDFTSDLLDQTKQFYVLKEANNFKTQYVKNFSSDNSLSRVVLQKFPQFSFLLEYSLLRVGGENFQKSFAGKKNDSSAENSQTTKTEITKSPDEEALIDWTIKNLQKRYPKLLILYFPYINYKNINESPSAIETSLAKITKNYNVDFVSMRQDFTNYYQLHQQPCDGFNNTLPGTGHPNAIGHKLTSERLAIVLKERTFK
jgi:lysophospholipase L1-like esterase